MVYGFLATISGVSTSLSFNFGRLFVLLLRYYVTSCSDLGPPLSSRGPFLRPRRGLRNSRIRIASKLATYATSATRDDRLRKCRFANVGRIASFDGLRFIQYEMRPASPVTPLEIEWRARQTQAPVGLYRLLRLAAAHFVANA